MSIRISTLVRPVERISLVDREFDSIEWRRVACALLTCGTERRSIALFARLPESVRDRVTVCEFASPAGDTFLRDNRSVYRQHLSEDQFFVPNTDIRALIELVQNCLYKSRSGLDTIFIDISSMPRVWYLGIVMWFRFSEWASSHRIVLAYVGGTYELPYPDRLITELRSVVGTGGYYDASQPTVAVVGVGFDAGAAQTVEEKIEPDRTIVVVSRTPTNHLYRSISEDLNKDFIERADGVIYLSAASFAAPFQGICELVAPMKDVNVVCVPLGPKPHVLAFALAGLIFPRVSSIHVVSRYMAPFHADSSGEISAGELTFVMQDDLKS